MKNKHLPLTVILITLAIFSSCKKNAGFEGEPNFDKNASYALGLNIGAGLRDSMNSDGIIPNLDEFFSGMKDGITGAQTRIDIYDARNMIEEAFNALQEDRNSGAIQAESEFMAENAKKPGVRITHSGLQYEVIREGDGPKPGENDVVQVHYEGRLTDGTLFDNSYEHQQPVEFALNQVIVGWSEGLQLMNVGSKYILYVPSELGYGQSGMGPIPPYSALIFTVELLGIVK